jgi:hypothetical protein
MKMNRAALIVAAVLAAVATIACTSSAQTSKKQTAKTSETPPAWVLNPPEPDAQFYYFVGSGESKSGSMAESEEFARGALIDEIMRYLGVRISSETTATAKASLESYQADVVQTLKSTSAGRVVGLEIAERWVSRREGRTAMYLLARYNKNELAKEKRRLEEIFREKVEAISGPEQEGRELEGRGELYQAALRYLEAAAAASRSELENADVKFERNMNQAREAVRRIGLVKLNDNLKVHVGKEFPAGFQLKVVAGAAPGDPGISGAPVRVSYKEMKSSGRASTRSQLVKSGEKGELSFLPPPPEFVGAETLTMALDLGEALEALQEVPNRLYGQVEAMEELVRTKSVRFAYESLSLAGTIPTGIAVFDLDATGSPISLTETSSGLLGELSKAGFKVVVLPVEASTVAGRPDAKVIDTLASGYQGQVERAIFGTARIADTVQEGQTIIIQVSGGVKVVELATGKILLAVDKNKRAQGSNVAAALATAFKKLGEDLGQAIANQLR